MTSFNFPSLDRAQRICLIVGAVISAVVFFGRHETISSREAGLALVLIWVGATPAIIYLRNLECDKRPVPLMELTAVFYAATFGLPVFFSHRLRGIIHDAEIKPNQDIEFYNQVFLSEVSLEAQILAIVGVALLLGIWALARRFSARARISFTTPKSDHPTALVWLASCLAAASLSYHLFPYVQSLPSVGQFLMPAGYLAFALFFMLWRRRLLARPIFAVYFFLFVPLWLVKVWGGGALLPVLNLGVMACALYLMEGGRIPWKTALFTVLVIVAAYPVLNSYRTVVGQMAGNLSTAQKIEKFFELGIQRYGPSDLPKKLGMGPIRRISLILVFADVVDKTPDQVPYWSGASYAPLFGSWIPRAIWPGKPLENAGNTFGRRYEILRRGELGENVSHYYPDHEMSLNIPWITEMYANFGRWGVIVGMALVGAVLGLLEAFFFRENMSIAATAVGVTVMLPLFFQESNLSLMTGSLLPLTLCLWAYFQIGLRLPLFRSDAG